MSSSIKYIPKIPKKVRNGVFESLKSQKITVSPKQKNKTSAHYRNWQQALLLPVWEGMWVMSVLR
jgi:hypothetical protein